MRASAKVLYRFNQFLVLSMQSRSCVYEALDTMGCATRNAKRRGQGWYEGLNVITSVTADGLITGFGCAPASTKEQPYAETFLGLRAINSPDLPEVGRLTQCTYITDNGFCGKSNHQRWQQYYSARVITPPQRSHPNSWSKALRRWLSGL